MKYFRSCVHPVVVKNKYGELHKVGCGHCVLCNYRKSLSWSTRLNLEAQESKYVFFFTLTYADDCLPYMLHVPAFDSLVVPDDTCVDHFGHDERCGLCIDLKSYNWTESDRKSFDSIISSRGFLPILSRRDVQLFVKRVRRSIQTNFISKCSDEKEKEKYKISYAICGEYGPTTFRPHFHGVFMFDNFEIAREISRYIHKAWSYGSSRVRILGDAKGVDYVSRYVSGLHSLPQFFKLKEIRPFLLVSKSNLIGARALSETEIQRVFDRRSSTFTCFVRKDKKQCELPLWPSLERKFFPKFVGYDYLSYRLRVRLLGLVISSRWSFPRFKYEVYDYLNSVPFSSDDKFFYSEIREYFELICSKRSSEFARSSSRAASDSALYSLWSAARIVYKNALRFLDKPDVGAYVHIIDEYYRKRDYDRLCSQLKFEAILSNKNDFVFIDEFSNDTDALRTGNMRLYLNKVNRFVSHSHKNKAKNNYLSLHPEYKVFRADDDFDEGFV